METITAVYDGKVFVPEEAVNLSPNARVRLMVDAAPRISKEERRKALEVLLQDPGHSGGVDWSEWDRGDVYP